MLNLNFLHIYAFEQVLKAVVHGDSVLFDEHPELMEAKVWVYFHSKSIKYNRVECWGALKDAMQVRIKNKLTRTRIFDYETQAESSV